MFSLSRFVAALRLTPDDKFDAGARVRLLFVARIVERAFFAGRGLPLLIITLESQK
jgi:hypothetical protein